MLYYDRKEDDQLGILRRGIMFTWLKELLDDDRPAPVAEKAHKGISTPIDHILKLMESTPDRFGVDVDVSPSFNVNSLSKQYTQISFTVKDIEVPSSIFKVSGVIDRVWNSKAQWESGWPVPHFSGSLKENYHVNVTPSWVTQDEAAAIFNAVNTLYSARWLEELKAQDAINVAAQKEADRQRQIENARAREKLVALYGEVDR